MEAPDAVLTALIVGRDAHKPNAPAAEGFYRKAHKALGREKFLDVVSQVAAEAGVDDMDGSMIRFIKRLFGRCFHKVCWKPGCACYLPDEQSTRPSEFYCPDHAHGEGYCYSCGLFWAGVNEFDFSPFGLCPNCEDEIRTEFDDYDEMDCMEWGP